MSRIRSRIDKLSEKMKPPAKTVCFTITKGKASGRAWHDDRLNWENLSRPEYEQLKADLEAEGVQIIAIELISAFPSGESIGGWGDVYNDHEKKS